MVSSTFVLCLCLSADRVCVSTHLGPRVGFLMAFVHALCFDGRNIDSSLVRRWVFGRLCSACFQRCSVNRFFGQVVGFRSWFRRVLVSGTRGYLPLILVFEWEVALAECFIFQLMEPNKWVYLQLSRSFVFVT